MRKVYTIFGILLIELLFAQVIYSQNNASDYKYRIQFTDKKNCPYSKDNPIEYLSLKAIQRRVRQNIKIKENDLPVNQSYVDSICRTGVKVLNRSKWLNYVTIDKADSLKLLKIKSFKFVSKIEKIAYGAYKRNYKLLMPEKDLNPEVAAISKVNYSINYKSRKGNIYDYGYSFEQVNMIACDSLHAMGFRGKGMTIAVLDAGFLKVDSLPIFDSLRENGRIIGTKDFVCKGGNVFNAGTHGMMVLSTMAGNLPDEFLGTAPDADYLLLRTEDANSEYIIEEDNWVSAAEYADSTGVDIINSSLGYNRFSDSTEDHKLSDLNGKTSRISIAATIAAEKGILVVNSAGNEGSDQSWEYRISMPADADSIISVGAVDKYGKYANFSSRGPTADGRLKPEVVAMGLGSAVSGLNGNIISANGTSFSSPIVAGMTACIWQTKKEKSNMDVINSIIKSCNHYTTPDIFTGYGIPHAYKAYLILSDKVHNNAEFENSINVSSYPYNNDVYITYVLSEDSEIRAEMYDLSGKSVYKSSVMHKQKGYSYITISNFKELSKGIYILKLYTNDKIFIKKLMKLG